MLDSWPYVAPVKKRKSKNTQTLVNINIFYDCPLKWEMVNTTVTTYPSVPNFLGEYSTKIHLFQKLFSPVSLD